MEASQQTDGKPLCPENKAGKKVQRERMAGDYYLSFVEFDDQGWFADRRQMDALFALLKRLEEKDKKSTATR